MFWLLLTLLVIAGAVLVRRRRLTGPLEDEPWRASLEQGDEPLDIDEIRRAEEEWTAQEWEDSAEDDEWR